MPIFVNKIKDKPQKKQSKNAGIRKNTLFYKYQKWNKLLSLYKELKNTKQNLKIIKKEIILHYLKNFFLFPIWFFKFLIPNYLKTETTFWSNIKKILFDKEFKALRLVVVSQHIFIFFFFQIGAIIFYKYAKPIKAATYGWVQTAWTDANISATVASHDSNQTGWTSYTEKTNLVNTDTLSITTTTYTSTDSANFTSNGLASGGGFGNAITSTVNVSGSSATLGVASAGGELLQWDPTAYSLPGTISDTKDGNGNMVSDGTNFYIIKAGGSNKFYKFNYERSIMKNFYNLLKFIKKHSHILLAVILLNIHIKK
jgi:hypothetical protein